MRSLRPVTALAAALALPSVLGLHAGSLDAAAQGAKPDRSRIVGTYRLIGTESRDASGRWVRTPNFASYGYVVYYDTGHVAQYTTSRTSPRLNPTPGQPVAPQDALAVLQNLTAFYGTFSVDDKSKAITHRYAGNMVPHAADEKLAYEIDGDRFTLMPGPATGSGKAPGRVVWEKLPEPPLSAEARKFVGFYKLLYTDTLREKGGKEISHENRNEARAGSAILYTASGHMMAHLMNKDKRIKYEGAEATPAEAQAAFSSYSGYFGRFTPFENYKPVFVFHNQQGTTNPGREVDATKRFYQFTGNVLRLGGPPTTNEEGITSYGHLYWERQPAAK
jgi:hypothetical protein